MGMWDAIFLIVFVSVVVEAIAKIYKVKVSTEAQRKGSVEANAEVLARLDRMERRIANLETIVLESEKKREFERAL